MFVVITFDVAVLTAGDFDQGLLARVLAKVAGVSDTWVEVSIPDSAARPSVRRRLMVGQKTVLQSDASGRLLVDTKIYATNVQEVISKVGRAADDKIIANSMRTPNAVWSIADEIKIATEMEQRLRRAAHAWLP
jgi:hypothetical protein